MKYELNIVPGTLIELLLADGTKLQGLAEQSSCDALSLKQADGTLTTISPDVLAQAVYAYAGFPTRQAGVQRPTPAIANGRITSFNAAGMGFVETTGTPQRRLLIHTDSFLLDDELKALARQAPQQLAGCEVLFTSRKVNGVDKAFLMKATTLDAAVDGIVLLAGRGLLAEAEAFCRLLLATQCPGDEELNRFLVQLTTPPEPDSNVLDYYQPVAPRELPPDWNARRWLQPQGRIIRVGAKDGHIVDVRSHQQLFFFREQLMGQLADKSDSELTGLPVAYSIARSKNGQGFQARSVMQPMKFADAFDMAEDMHYDQFDTLGLNA